jgi:hypothetical protein
MTTIADSDVSGMNGDTVDDAAEALLARFMPEGDPDAPKKKEPSAEGEPKVKPEKTATPEPEDDDEPSDESPEDEGDEDGEEKPAEKKKPAVDDDEAYVKIKEGDEEHEVPVKELKRLWGQEAALTRKSQEVAEQRKTAEAEVTKTTTVLSALLKRAQDAAKPYADLDLLVLSKDPAISAADLKALSDEKQARTNEVKFLETELNGFMQAINAKKQNDIVEGAKTCLKALNDAAGPHHIPDWGDKLYGELRDFAVGEGFDNNTFNQLVDPASVKLLHMAMQFKRGQSKVITTKVNKTATKIVKTSTTPVISKSSKTAEDKAMRRLKNDGSTDAAAELLMQRWAAKSSDE